MVTLAAVRAMCKGRGRGKGVVHLAVDVGDNNSPTGPGSSDREFSQSRAQPDLPAAQCWPNQGAAGRTRFPTLRWKLP
jgi:hypothetical protein